MLTKVSSFSKPFASFDVDRSTRGACGMEVIIKYSRRRTGRRRGTGGALQEWRRQDRSWGGNGVARWVRQRRDWSWTAPTRSILDGGGGLQEWRRWTAGSDGSEIDLEAVTVWLDRYSGGGMTNQRRWSREWHRGDRGTGGGDARRGRRRQRRGARWWRGTPCGVNGGGWVDRTTGMRGMAGEATGDRRADSRRRQNHRAEGVLHTSFSPLYFLEVKID
jgi:hypothetical protein